MTRRQSYQCSYLIASALVFATCVCALCTAGATTCDDLSKIALPQTAIAVAASVAHGMFAPPPSLPLTPDYATAYPDGRTAPVVL